MSGPGSAAHRAGPRLADLGYRVGSRDILVGIDCCLPATGITAVIGPNGAGKTTLLRLLHGMVRPSLGRIELPPPASGGAQRHQPTTGLLLQRPVLLRRSVRANIRFALMLNGGRSDRMAEDRLLARAGLSALAERPARRLSGGEQQRLALARELARAPRMMLMDEPGTGLDPAATGLLEDLIRTLAADGTPVLFTSHDLGQVRRLADHCLFLHHGRLAAEGALPAILEDPPKPALAAFLNGVLI